MTESAQPPAARASHPLLAVISLCFGGLVAALTQTMVIPVQGRLPQLLDTSPSNAAWVVTITLLAAAVTTPISGRLADMYGKQPILVASSAILLVGSVVSALSDALAPLLVGRSLQGMAMGFIPVGIALLREIVPARLASSAIAAMSATLGVGGAIGLPLSAWIVQVGSWHALFWVSAVAAVPVLAAVLWLVPHQHDAEPARLDVPGAVGLAAGLVLVLLGFTKASTWGWGTPRTVGSIVVGLVVLVLWAVLELRTTSPLVNLRSSARRPVLLTNLAAVVVGIGMMAQAIVVPQLLQLPDALDYGLGQSILQAGLWMAPGGLMMLVFAPVSSRLIDGVGARRTLMTGAAVLGTGYLVAFLLMGSPLQLMSATIVISIGVAIGYAAMPTLVLDASPATESGSAVGVNTLMRSLGTTIASAVMATVLTGSTNELAGVQVPSEAAFQICFAISAAAALLAVGLVWFIPRSLGPGAEPAEVAAQPVAAGRSTR